MRSGDLRTFSLERRGTRVIHVRSPGHMNWTHTEGIIACEIRCPPSDGGKEWQLLGNVVGRLSDRHAPVGSVREYGYDWHAVTNPK